MKKRIFLFYILFVFAGLLPLFAQVDPQNLSICKGISIPVSSLYRVQTGYTVTKVLDESNVNCLGKERLSPTTNTTYKIFYTENGQSGELGPVTATVSVYSPSTLKVEFTNAASVVNSDGWICPGKTPMFKVVANGGNDPVYWSVSGMGISERNDNSFTMTANSSCWVTASASNGYCSPADTSFRLNVFLPDEIDNSSVEIRSVFGDKEVLCADCGFSPDLEDVVWVKADYTSSDEIDYDASSLTWEDGSSAEIPLRVGTMTQRAKLHYVIKRQTSCGIVTATVDTTFDITLLVKNCSPLFGNIYIKPCTEAILEVLNLQPSVVELSHTPSDPWKSTELSAEISGPEHKTDMSEGKKLREAWRWCITLNNFDADKPTKASLQVDGTASYTCYFSQTSPITVSYTKTADALVRTNFLEAEYNYCPGAEGELKLTLPDGGSFTQIEFKEPAGVENRLNQITTPSGIEKKYETNENLTAANIGNYSPLKLNASYEISKGNCTYIGSEEYKLECKPRSGCNMSFNVATAPCIGQLTQLKMDGGAMDIVVDSIRIDDAAGFVLKTGGFTQGDKTGSLAFYPYYAGAQEMEEKRDTMLATAFYRMAGSEQTLQWNARIPMTVKSCGPKLNTNSSGEYTKCTGKTCPGFRIYFTLDYENPTTDKDNLKFLSNYEPKARVVDIKADKASGMARLRLSVDFFETTDFKLLTLYNQGDSTYIADIPFTVTHGNGQRVILDECGIGKIVKDGRDTCCIGDKIEVDLVNGNACSSRFYHIEWDPSVLQEVGQTDYVSAAEGSEDKYHVKLQASRTGIYPFVITRKVYDDRNMDKRYDTLITYPDTLRLFTIEKPHIFTIDTLLSCTGASFDPKDYIDEDILRTYNTSSPISSLSNDQTIYATGEMHAVCDAAAGGYINSVRDSMFVSADVSVYLDFIPDADICPADSVLLSAATNGTCTWYRQTYSNGGYGFKEMLAQDVKSYQTLKDAVSNDTVLYTVEARTSCPTDGLRSTSFLVKPKEVPSLVIEETRACGAEPFLLRLENFNAADFSQMPRWFDEANQPLGTGDGVEVPTNGRSELKVSCTAVGTSGCSTSAEGTVYSSPMPNVNLRVAVNDLEVDDPKQVCVNPGDEVVCTATGDASDYMWYSVEQSVGTGQSAPMQGRVLRMTVNEDAVWCLHSKSESGCEKTDDTVGIVLYPRLQRVSDTSACLNEAFYFELETEADVSYAWIKDNNVFCSCPYMDFVPFEVSDTGSYQLRATRKGCTPSVPQTIRFSAYPDPGMEIGGDTAYCAGSSAVLRIVFSDGRPDGFQHEWRRPDASLSRDDEIRWNAVSQADAGKYYLLGRVNGCLYRDSVTLVVDAHTTPDFSLQNFYCEGENLEVEAERQGENVNYIWYNDTRYSGPSKESACMWPSLSLTDAGNLYLVVVNGVCRDTVFRRLEVREKPEAVLKAERERVRDDIRYFCENDSLRLYVENALAGDIFTWYHPTTTVVSDRTASYWKIDSLKILDQGTYGVTVNRGGCVSDKQIVTVEVRRMPRLILQDSFYLCEGNPIEVDAENPSYEGAVYTWKELGVTGPVVRIEEGGTYTVSADLDGCVAEAKIAVEARPVPDWDFPEDTLICQRDSLVLHAPENMDSYLWQDGSSALVYVVTGKGVYSLKVTKDGCENEKRVLVETEFCSPIFFPTAFSPNGDNINDEFGPITIAEAEELTYLFEIFDSRGERVFVTTDIHAAWDGTFKGKLCAPGIYTYRCRAFTREDGRNVSKSGTVNLLR